MRLDKLFPQAPTGRTGSTKLNVLPLRGALSTVTSPLSSRARLLLTLTPSPVPPVAHASPLNEVLPFSQRVEPSIYIGSGAAIWLEKNLVSRH